MATLPLSPGSSSKPPASCRCPVLPSRPAVTRGALQRPLPGLGPPPPAPALSVQTNCAASTNPGRLPRPSPHACRSLAISPNMSLQAQKLSPLSARRGELCARLNYRKLGATRVYVCTSACARVHVDLRLCASCLVRMHRARACVPVHARVHVCMCTGVSGRDVRVPTAHVWGHGSSKAGRRHATESQSSGPCPPH